MNRRAYLGLVGTAAIAGCLGDDTGSDDEEGDQDDDDSSSGEQEDGTPSFDRQWSVSLETDVANKVNMDAATAEGKFYLGSEAGLTAVDVAEGTKRWSDNDRTEFAEVEATAETVAALTRGGELLSLTPDGGVNWAQAVPDRSIALADGRIAGASRDGVTVYDAAAGDEVWTADGARTVYATSETVVAARGLDPTTGHDIASGDQRWETDADIRRGGAVVPGEGLVIGIDSSRLQSVTAVEIATGDVRWSVDEFELSPFVSIGVGEGIATFLDDSGEEQTLVAVSLSDGAVMWEESIGTPAAPLQPLVGAGVVIAETGEDYAAFDPETGERYDGIDEFTIVGAIEDGYFLGCRTEITGYDL